MLNVLYTKLQKLLRNEEGFAIAMTIIVWPVMLITVSGIFVTGETIRRKMILQNAADAAAHAGAQLQADTLSRAAVINRMMAWTYLQANKMEMDYTVLNWAALSNKVMNELKSPLTTTAAAISPTCQHPDHKKERSSGIIRPQWGWFAGNGGTLNDLSYTPAQMLLNNHDVMQTKIDSIAPLSGALKNDLDSAFANISSMNLALNDLSNQFRNRFKATVETVFQANIGDLKGKTKLWFRENSLSDFLVPMSDESAFLRLAGEDEAATLLNAKGAHWWQPDGRSEAGFRRAYTGQGLEAQFRIGLRGWQNSVLLPAVCVPYITKYATVYIQGTGAVRSDGITASGLQGTLSPKLTGEAINAYSKDFLGYNKAVRALPRQLDAKFIEKGAVLVAARSPLKNPLSDIFGDLTGRWFDAHSVNDAEYWCMSAARACPRDWSYADARYSRKNFASFSPGNADYAAVMLPISMAGSSAGEVVREVHESFSPQGWEKLADWSMLNNFASRGD